MNKKSAAQILMVNNDATFDQIKYNYRKLALELHPDKNNGQNSDEKFKMITFPDHSQQIVLEMENNLKERFRDFLYF